MKDHCVLQNGFDAAVFLSIPSRMVYTLIRENWLARTGWPPGCCMLMIPIEGASTHHTQYIPEVLVKGNSNVATGARLVAMLLGLTAVAGHAEERRDLNAVVSWNGHGQIVRTAADEQEFLGTFDGVMYIETAEGALNEAFVECSARHNLHRGDSLTQLSGRCTVVQSADDNVFASFDCRGELGACKGEFSLTGGTGAFEGISGSSSLIMRSPLRHLIASMTSVEEIVVRNGVMLLTDLSYSVKGGDQ